MYFYYFLAELKLIDRRYGGIFVTPLQLAQFILCILSVPFLLATASFPTYFHSQGIYETINISSCNKNGTGYYSAAWLWIQYGIFLVLFARLFLQKAHDRRTTAKPSKSAGKGKEE